MALFGFIRGSIEEAWLTPYGLALIFLGLGFGVMVWASILTNNQERQVGMLWLNLTYLFHTVGELCLSPVGLSTVTKLAPHRKVGQMMGIWFLATALGNLIAGLVGGNVNPENLPDTPRLFLLTTLFLFGAAFVLGLLVTPIRRMMADK